MNEQTQKQQIEIRISDCVPDTTYFRRGDAEPTVRGTVITIQYGRGARRGWGSPQVNTTVLIHEPEFAAMLIGFSHKHGGGQFYRYYEMTDDGQIVRRIWRGLSEARRQQVLDAYHEKAPSWAKRPGNVEQPRPHTHSFTAYKILRVLDDNVFQSMYDGTTWELGRRNVKAVWENAGWDEGVSTHDGGYYVHTDISRIRKLFAERTLAPARCFTPGRYVLVECECGGRVARFPSGKLACTYCKPVRVIEYMEI